MNLNQLRHFVALVEHGSFTRAAQVTRLTQPALSRSIALLEEELGMKLFDRIGRRNELTVLGRVALEHVRHILFEAGELSRCAAMQMAGGAGQIRIGLGSTPSALLMTPLLTHMARHYPSLRITLMKGRVEQQVEALRERGLDALVVDMRSVTPTPELHIEQLPDLRAGWICRHDHPLARRKSLVFDTVRRWPIACTMTSDEVARQLVSIYGPQAHPAECVTLCCEDIASLLGVVRGSDAILVGTVAPARALIDAGELIELPVHPAPVSARFAIVRLAGRTVAPAFELIREFVVKRLHD